MAGVRLFENATDPQSNAAGMLGGDFNNYFANALNFADVYQSNYNNTGTSCTVVPVATPDVVSTPVSYTHLDVYKRQTHSSGTVRR